MILYPNRDDSSFDMQYYLDVHMPLVEKHWRPVGLLSWKIIEFNARKGDAQISPQSIANLMTWEDEASYRAAFEGPGASLICGDTSKFCNQQPILIAGRTIEMG